MKVLYTCVALALLASCSSDIDDASGIGEKFTDNIILNAGSYDFEEGSRISLTNTGSSISFGWKDGESISVFPITPAATTQERHTITLDGDSLNTEFNGAGWALIKGSTYAIYSPCVTETTRNAAYTDIPVSMTGQKQTGNASLTHISDNYDYMYAKADVPTQGCVSFDFQHIGAIVMLQLTMPNDTTAWKSATLASDSSVFITDCTMNIANGTLADTVTSDAITLELDSVSGSDITLYMSVLPCTTGDLTLTVMSAAGKSFIASLDSKTIMPDKAYRWEATPEAPLFVKSGTENGYDYADLGLSVKWATMNVGAVTVADQGTYFAWGEVTGCESNPDGSVTAAVMDGNPYSWQVGVSRKYTSGDEKTDFGSWTYYKWYDGSTYYKYTTSEQTLLDTGDDAAAASWGEGWSIPTGEEQAELLNGCYWVWTDDYNETGIAGYIVYKALSNEDRGIKVYRGNSPKPRYKLSENHIFLPAAGYRYRSSFKLSGYYGYYWSSSLSSDNSSCADSFFFGCSHATSNTTSRFWGMPVRAVLR